MLINSHNMKTANNKELREQKIEQLYKDLASANKELRDVRFKIANREMEDVNAKNGLRKKIARLWTIIREKEYENIQINTN